MKVKCDICGQFIRESHNCKSIKLIKFELWKKITNSTRYMFCHYRKRAGLSNRSATKMGINNPMWKGDKVGYGKLHVWIKSRKPKPQFCIRCNNPPYDLANISGQYRRDVNDYEWLCRRCHMLSDGRMNNLKQFKMLL